MNMKLIVVLFITFFFGACSEKPVTLQACHYTAPSWVWTATIAPRRANEDPYCGGYESCGWMFADGQARTDTMIKCFHADGSTGMTQTWAYPISQRDVEGWIREHRLMTHERCTLVSFDPTKDKK